MFSLPYGGWTHTDELVNWGTPFAGRPLTLLTLSTFLIIRWSRRTGCTLSVIHTFPLDLEDANCRQGRDAG